MATSHPISSACNSKIDEFSNSPSKQNPGESKTKNNIIRHPTHDDITFVERTACESSFPRVVLSSKRQQAITALPPAALNVEDRHLNNTFDREFLKIILGRSLTRLALPFFMFVNLLHSDFGLSHNLQSSSGKQIASYLCPTLNHHPWCPSRTGEHGFIFVGLGKDKDSYRSTAIRNVFVGLPKTVMDNRRFRYLGKYKVTRVDPLSVDEWAMLSAEVSVEDIFTNLGILRSVFFFFFQFKAVYAKLTMDKTNDTRTLEDVVTDYENGNLHVPCVQLQCIGFDDLFFKALLSQRNVP